MSRGATHQDSLAIEEKKMSKMPRARTIPELVDEMAERYPDREAIVGSGQRYTYAQLREEVRRVAKGLAALGVRRGDKVAILMGNCPEWIITDLAICMIGGVMVAVNTWATPRELEYILQHSDSTVLVMAPCFLKYDYLSMLGEFEPLAKRFPKLREVIVRDDRYQGAYRTYSGLREMASGTSDAQLEAMQNQVGACDIAYLLYTSGSTSAPKGVQLAHFGLIEHMWRVGERQHVTEQDRFWFAVSLFWGLGCENELMNILTHGACAVLQESFDPEEAIALIARERCTIFYGTANIAQAIYDLATRGVGDVSTLRGGMTAGSPEQVKRVADIGVREICNVYGLTETYGTCNVTDAHDPLDVRMHSVGRAIPGVEQRIVNPDTEEILPAGEIGEIRVRGYATPGYFKDPERTAEAYDSEGFFRTGDLGRLDADGYLYFMGRLKEMVKTGGINVSPVEVEEILQQHPQVDQAYCTGVDDPERDQILAAVIVPKGSEQPSDQELVAYCRQYLAAYKVPRRFRIATAAELPLTTTGKIKKNELAQVFFSADAE
jgi:fatty-acyl-CoA synthase